MAPRTRAGPVISVKARSEMQGGLLKSFGPSVALIALIVIFAVTSRQFFTGENAAAILESAAISAILVVGMTFVIVQGSIDLSVEGAMASSSMVTSLLIANTITSNDLGWLAIAAGMAFGLVFGLANGLIYAFVRLPSLIVTLATWFVGLGIATLIFPGRQPQILDPLLTNLVLDKHFGLSWIVFIAVLAVVIGWLLQQYTQFGRVSFAIGADERTARLSGLAIRLHKVLAFALMGLLAGLCGILISSQLSVGSPVAGQGLLFPTISAAVVGGTLLSGGRGGVLQSAVGVLILEVLRNGMVQWGVDTYLRHVVEGAAIIAALAFGNWQLRSRTRVVK